jgi:hypothetical protein
MYSGSGEEKMLRRNGSGRLRSNQKPKEDINPMNGIANLVDAMLVLAVGIMLALIISWNLNVSSSGQVTADAQNEEESTISKDDALTTFTGDDMETAENDEVADGSNLEEQGTVYYDKNTDTYYIIASDGTTESLDGNQ